MRFLFVLISLIYLCKPTQAEPWPGLEITTLCPDFYIYTTYGDPGNGQAYPANGMYLVDQSGVFLFDTPWDTTLFNALLDSIQMRHHKKVIGCIATHFHEDRTAGLQHYRKLGIPTYTSSLTDQYAQQKNHPRAEFLLKNDSTFTLTNHSFQTFFPGHGHSPDNILIWFPQEQILYGGCFIKSSVAKGLGNLSDANINAWWIAVQKTMDSFPTPAFIIPGHDEWKGNKSLEHTKRLLKKEMSKTGNRKSTKK